MAKKISQLKLPDPNDTDPHPRLLLDGYGIHAGQCVRALFPDGWHDITLEVGWEETGPVVSRLFRKLVCRLWVE